MQDKLKNILSQSQALLQMNTYTATQDQGRLQCRSVTYPATYVNRSRRAPTLGPCAAAKQSRLDVMRAKPFTIHYTYQSS